MESNDHHHAHANPDVAPFMSVPSGRLVSIEHPCIVRNFDNAFKSLGGEAQIKHVLEHHVGDSKLSSKQNQLPEPVAGVSLRPNDVLAKKLPSVGVETRNILVKVILPKRTGRKRKRGSDEPFTASSQSDTREPNPTAPELLRRLRDNAGNYRVEPVGMLRETHRFRTLPDFQLRNADMAIMRELRSHVLHPDYDRLKRFNVDMTPHPTTADIFPGPPTFTSFDIPHKYEYQQASGVIFVQDESGQVVSKNISAPPKRVTWGLPPDVDEVPQKPPMEIPTKNPAGEMLPRAIKELQKLLDDRPLVTKRVALNAMPPISDTIFKEATQFVGYSFKAGPWRDSLIKYGVDPRTDPKYRFYQTLMFQVDKEAFKPVPDDKQPMLKSTETNSRWARPLRHTRDDPTTHIFDGKNITANGKTWQVCDVTDPVVRDIFATDDIPATCDVYQWGWYHNGTLAKARTIMKDKMRYLFAREEPPHDDYAVLATIPHLLTKANMKTAVMNPRLYNKNVVLLANEVRNIVKTGDGSRSTKNMWISRAEKGGDPSVPTEQEGDGENEGEGDEDGGGGMVRDFVVGEGGGDFDDDGNS